MVSVRRRRILAFDGGGVRGAFTARIVERLSEARPGFLQPVELLAGTSTGSIIAAGLASGISPRELVDFYRNDSRRAFADSLLDDVRDLGRLRGADYSSAPLKRLLGRIFGETRLGELAKPILVPAFDLDNGSGCPAIRTWKPKFFDNIEKDGPDCEERLVDVIMRSCAAPVYFPSYQGYIDGGIVANNPSLAALARLLHSKKTPLEEVRLLSIGTGQNLEYISGRRHDWGLAQWAPILPRLFSAGSMGVVDYQCRQLLGSGYHRLSTTLQERIPSDAVDLLDRLVEIADETDISPTLDWIEREWSRP